MTDTRDPNRRVKFEEAGEGIYLLLRNSGCRYLQAQIGIDWFSAVERALLFYNIEVIEHMLAVMPHTATDKQKKLTLDDMPDDLTMESLANKLLDAFCLAMHGRDYKEQLAWIEEEGKKLQKKAEGENPPTGLADSSAVSSEEPSGPDSDQPSSTT